MTGAQARQRREAVRKTVRATAKKAGFSAAALSRFERGIYRSMLPVYAESLDRTLSAFEREQSAA